jgi:hypothetical protein
LVWFVLFSLGFLPFSCPALAFHLIEDVHNWHVIGVTLFKVTLFFRVVAEIAITSQAEKEIGYTRANVCADDAN